MEIQSINRNELAEALSKRRKRNVGRIAEVMLGLKCLQPGESLKVSFDSPKEAKSCRSGLNTKFKNSTIDNGNLCTYKAVCIDNAVYVYSTRVEFKAK